MIDFFIYHMLSKQKIKKVQQKQLQNKNHNWGQFDPTGTKSTFLTGRQKVKLSNDINQFAKISLWKVCQVI